MDFSAYTGWAIPEGNAVEVADASGRVMWKSGPTIIAFHASLNGKINTYNAEDGMTWDEFINSEYNTTFVIINNSPHATIGNQYGHVYDNAQLTLLTNRNDIIIAGHTYYSRTGGSGD